MATNGLGEDRKTWTAEPKHETWLLSDKSFGDCIVRFDFLAESQGVNSGFGLRAVPGEKPPGKKGTFPFPTHLQVEIFGQATDGTSKVQTGTVLGLSWQVVLTSSPVGKQRPAGEWNQMEIETRGQAIRVRLNGVSILDGSLDDLIDGGGKFPGLRRKSGRIGFQRLGGTIRFRNIQIKE